MKTISEMTTLRRLTQSGDDQQVDPEMQQNLEVESLDSGAGTFVRFSTERWCVESPEEIDALSNLLKEALKVNPLPHIYEAATQAYESPQPIPEEIMRQKRGPKIN